MSKAPPPADTSERPATREYRPSDRFWPYPDVPEHPTDDELALIDPDVREVLFGDRTERPFSLTLVFPSLPGEEGARAVELAEQATEYRVTGAGDAERHRARFLPSQARLLRSLFELVGPSEDTEVLIDDRPVPYARELWLPLFWYLIRD